MRGWGELVYRAIQYQQRMYYDSRFDLPLRPRSDPLQAYLCHNDLPRQLPSNPYAYDRPQNHTKSISRCAVTEISTHYEPDDSSSFTPSQPLFSIDQHQPTEIKEATFKPSDLQQLLRQGRANPSLKQMLVENVFSRSRNEAARRVSTQHNEKRQQSKTKYERILEEFFNRKPKQQTKNRISIDSLPNYRIQHLPNSQPERPEDSSKLQYLKELDQLSKEATQAVLSHCRTTRSLSTHPPATSQHMRKTFSHAKMPSKNTENRSSQGNNRKQKEQVGYQSKVGKQNRQLEGKLCGHEWRPRGKEQSAGSYAKQYYQKIRRRT